MLMMLSSLAGSVVVMPFGHANQREHALQIVGFHVEFDLQHMRDAMMRFFLRTFLIACPLVALFGCVLFWLVAGFTIGIDDAYAEWGAAEMVIDYMEEHDGKWPRDWEALRPYFQSGGGRVGGWSFEKYKDRIRIDFNADVRSLRQQSLASDSITFNVISASHNTGVHFGEGPNCILYAYFRTIQ
jgi:hypothetical protein